MPYRIAAWLIAGVAVLWIFAAPDASAHPPAEHPAETAAEDVPVAEPPAAEQAGHDETPHAHDQTVHDDPASEPDVASHDDDHEHAAQADDAGGGHAHWGENGPQTAFERAMARLGVLHSVAVHFPIALILVAALAQLLGLAGIAGAGPQTARFLVWTGALGGLAAGLLGWAHAGPMTAGEDGVMLVHRLLGSAMTIGLFGVAGLVEWQARRPGPLAGLLAPAAVYAAALAVAVNGFLGGSLAHGGLGHLIGG